jgi:hypothetical protein
MISKTESVAEKSSRSVTVLLVVDMESWEVKLGVQYVVLQDY